METGKNGGSIRRGWRRAWRVLTCRSDGDVDQYFRVRSVESCDGASKAASTGMAHEVIMKEFHIPDYILIPDSKVQNETPIPSCPVVVFINSRSGGQLGGDLLRTYRKLLNEAQVFDLGEEAPDKVLHRLYANLEKLKSCGDACATKIRESLRLIVAGGDGTASWLLGVVSDLKLDRPPPVATVPLGTGNNLPFSFGWGKKNPGTDDHSVKAFLTLVKEARKMEIDSWHIIMTMKTPKDGTCDPIAPLELPHSLHAFQRVSNKNSPTMEGYDTFRGGFWNYFSMGMDAEVSYAFHSERKKHPEKFKNQFTNQTTYAKIGFGTLAHPSPGIAQLAEVKISKGQDKWEVLHIDPSIRSIVCLNLPSFSGGFNPWGTPSRWRNDNWTPPFVDDGFIEVVGFKDAWHGLVLLTPRGHGIRLAQAHGIQFKFHKGAAAHTYMRIDGEPWKQPLPVDDDTVVVKISHHGQVSMLASGNCRSKGVQESSSPSSHQSGSGDNLDEDEESREEERRKFGAAETFKIDQEIDIAHLS